MRHRLLLASLSGLALAGSLLVSAPHVSAAPHQPARTDGMQAVVTAPVGGDWSVAFVDGQGTVLASVTHDAIALVTGDARVPADRVLSNDETSVELGTADPGLTATVRVAPDGEGTYAVVVTGHGDGITGTSLDLKAPKGERYLGMGERSDAVDHRGDDVLNRVQDGPYTPNQVPLVSQFVPAVGLGDRPESTYFPIPWILSTSGYGVLVDNDEDSSFELATAAHPDVNRIVVQSPELDLRVFHGPKPAEALARMTAAIGRQPAPSMPALYGAWFQAHGDTIAQVDAQRAAGVPLSVAQTYTHYLPCGVQVTANERALTQAMHDRGVAVTTYFNPMICTTYDGVYDEGRDAGAYTKNPDGSTLVYPYSTATHFVVSQFDFSGAPGRDLFQKLLGEAVDDGYDGWMEDFGEYTPDDAVSADGTPGPTMHNRYVEQYHGTARDFETKAPRPLLRFERSGWTGAVKDASIVWGGDPTTTFGFDGLSSSVTQGLTMGTSGVSVWGPDIGGFFTLFGDPAPTPELLNRWIEYGAFTGVMRLQAGGIQLGVSGERPYVDDKGVAPIWKTYTHLRTMLYPYIAGSQDAYQESGLPLMRHLALVHPDDPRAVRSDDEYLFGSDLLVAPIVKAGAKSRSVYLPRGRWFELSKLWDLGTNGGFRMNRGHALAGRRTVTADAPLDTIPLYLRAGAVVPMLSRRVQTLSGYGSGLVNLDDSRGRRVLLAAPSPGTSHGTLGPGETLTSTADATSWTIDLDAARPRTYWVRATLSGLDASWRPCTVTVDGQEVRHVRYRSGRQYLWFSTPATDGEIRVDAC